MAADRIPTEPELRSELSGFLEGYLSTKILDNSPGTLKMYILHARNIKKNKPYEKQILWNLARIEERLIDRAGSVNEKDLIICGFLIDESRKYIRSMLK